MDKEKIVRKFKEESNRWIKKAQELLDDNMDKVEEIKRLLHDAWEKIQSNKHFKHLLYEAETIISFIKDIIHGKYTKHSKWALSMAIATLLYVMSPLDIIPDFIPLVGLFDDAAVLAYAFSLLTDELKRYKDWQAGIEDGIIVEEFHHEEEEDKL